MIRLSAFADEAAADLDGQIAALKRERIPCLELRSIDGKNVLDFTLEEAEGYAARLREAGIEVWSIGSPLGKVKIDCDFDAYLEKVRHILALAKIFSCTRVRMFSFFEAYEAREEVIARLRRMVALAEAEGIHLYHENEKEIYGDTVARVEDLIRSVPGLRFIYDPANFIQCDADMKAAMNRLLGSISYFHIKDVIRESGELVPAGEGLDKPSRRVVDFKADLSLFTIPDHFVIGYGLDCGELYRNLPYIAEYAEE